MRKLLIFSGLLILFNSCTPLLTKYFLKDTDIVKKEADPKTTRRICSDPLNYVTTYEELNHLPMRVVKVNIHMMNSADSTHNYSEEEGREWAKNIIGAANDMFRNNVQAKLPEGNEIPVHPIRIRYKLTGRPGDDNDDGIYFHYDSKCCFSVKTGKNSTLYKRDMYNEHGIQKDTVLNIFISPIHPDSLKNKKKKVSMGGVALGKFIKMMFPYEPNGRRYKPWEIAGTLNHELGHIYSLVHAWAYDDGCDDTPKHELSIGSNNLMDYNSTSRSVTPCQIGKMHRRMSSIRSSSRKFLVKDWCEIDTNKNVVITDSVAWLGEKDMIANIHIKSEGVLELGCRLAMPRNGVISVAPGGKLILGPYARIHNDCGSRWQGIEIQKEGNLKGEVIFVGEPKLEDMMNPL